MDLTFIVNGNETIVSVKSSEVLLRTAAEKAMQQASVLGRPLDDFQCLCDDTTLDLDAKINDQWERDVRGKKTEVPVKIEDENKVLFLSLRAGYGG